MSIQPLLSSRASLDAYQRCIVATMRGDLRVGLIHPHAALEHLSPLADPAIFAAIARELADIY